MAPEATLLTGAAGFIGSHLARKLISRGEQVHAILRPTTSLERIADIVDRIVIHRVDLSDRDALRRCIATIAPQRVFHLAADTRMSTRPGVDTARAAISAYMEPALNLIEALTALPVPPAAFVRTGTIAEYGRAHLPFKEACRARPTTPYGAGMLAVTDCLEVLAPSLNFPVVTARLALVYGPGQHVSFLVPALIDACLSHRVMTLQRPRDRRDLVHVDDAVDALVCAADNAAPTCTIVNVASGVSVPVERIAALVANITGCDPDLITARQPMPGEAAVELCCCPDRMRRRFGWEQNIALGNGLRRTIEAQQRMRQMVR